MTPSCFSTIDSLKVQNLGSLADASSVTYLALTREASFIAPKHKQQCRKDTVPLEMAAYSWLMGETCLEQNLDKLLLQPFATFIGISDLALQELGYQHELPKLHMQRYGSLRNQITITMRVIYLKPIQLFGNMYLRPIVLKSRRHDSIQCIRKSGPRGKIVSDQLPMLRCHLFPNNGEIRRNRSMDHNLGRTLHPQWRDLETRQVYQIMIQNLLPRS